jgi:hypothetical protein
MSVWDSPSIGDAIAEGFSFFTHKAGGDESGPDPELAPWWQSVKGTDPAEALLGTYWVPRPDMYPNPVSEAQRWLDTIDRICTGWRNRPHALQIDAERWPAGDRTKPSPSYINILGSTLRAKMPKLMPIVYASAGQYGNTLAGLKFPFWNANYPSSMTGPASSIYRHVGGDSGPGWVPYSGQTPAIWQFTSSATIAGQTTSDANAFRGTLAQLTALVAPGWSDMLDDNDKAWLTGLVNGPYANSSTDGIPETPAGHWVLSQGIPDGTAAGARVSAWKVMQNLGAQLVAARADVAELQKQVAALVTPDPAVLAQAIAAAIPAELAGKVADVLAQRLSA